LRAAQNLLYGHGLFVGPALDGRDAKFFSTWAIGYPSAIAAFSYLSGLDVFWASKLCNFVTISIAILYLAFALKPFGYFASLAFLTASPLLMLSYTLSEALFIAFLTIFCTSLTKLLESENLSSAIILSISAIGLALTRYIGVFAIVVLSVIAANAFMNKNKRTLVILICVTVTVVLAVGFYFSINFFYTGYFAGAGNTATGPRLEDDGELVRGAIAALARELNFLTKYRGSTKWAFVVFVCGYVLSAWLVVWVTFKLIKEKSTDQPLGMRVFFSVGALYLATLVVLRWNLNFDPIDERLLAPFAVMALIGMSIAIEADRSGVWLPRGIFWTIAVASAIYNSVFLPSWSVHSGNKTWPEERSSISWSYRSVPEGVAFFSRNDVVALLRDDLRWYRIYNIEKARTRVIAICKKRAFVYSDDAELLESFHGVLRFSEVEYMGKQAMIGKIICSEINRSSQNAAKHREKVKSESNSPTFIFAYPRGGSDGTISGGVTH
jgi:hypothetical protein